ncbi:MAG: biotin--[acetyl-CoA-carboxylase] ligase [Acutalibacteraceae bacterium]
MIQPQYINLNSCPSTNDELYALARNGAPAGTVITAKEQTKGKGTNGRSFYSPGKTGVYMSILLRGISNERMLDITPLAAVAVSKALDSLCGTTTKIKPVNDIYLSGKKICGILTQAQSTEKNVDFIIVGIGINLFRPSGGFPHEIKDIAGYVLEAYNEDMRLAVIEKVTSLLLDGSERIEDSAFRAQMYEYYNDEQRRFLR